MSWLRRRLGSVEPLKLPSYASLDYSETLIEKQRAAAAALPANSIKRLIEDQPDTFVDLPHVPEGA